MSRSVGRGGLSTGPLPGATLVIGMFATAAAAFAMINVAGSTSRTEPVAVIASEPLFSDDDGDAAMFSATDLEPDSPASRCIRVMYGGETANQPVRLTARNVSGPLAARLDVRVERGDGGGHDSCAGFTSLDTVYDGALPELEDAGGPDPGASTGWQPAGDETATFRVTVTVTGTVQPSPSTQATADFVWLLDTVPVTPAPTTPAPTPAPTATTQAPPLTTTASRTATTATPTAAAPSASPSPEPAPSADDGADEALAVPAPTDPATPDRPSRLDHVLDAAGKLAAQAIKHAAFPVALIVALALFLMAQQEADRRDPKLALAPVHRSNYVVIPTTEEDRAWAS